LRLDELQQEEKTPDRAFGVHFERVCIFDAQGDKERCQHEIDWLAHNLEIGDPQHIFALYHWLDSRDANTQRLVRVRMFHPEHFQRIVAGGAPPAVREFYLDQFIATKVVRLESALLALGCTNRPDVVAHALRILLAREHPDAVRHLLDQAAAGAFSEQDALALLKENAPFSLKSLRKEKPSSLRERLISTLLPHDKTRQLIRPGYWVRCEAGWGHIVKIRVADQEAKYFDPEIEQPALEVTLRPDRHPEQILVDLAARTITFVGVKEVIQCRKPDCPGFVSVSQERVVEEHNRAAHLGIGPAFRPIPASWRYDRAPAYQPQPPPNMLV
jgi:hypothetical protein